MARLQRLLVEHLPAVGSSTGIQFKPAAGGTAVSLLLDNSGSLRGQPILSLACLAATVMEWLEVNGADVEVLGYTTRAWRGGQSREAWLAHGRPPQPGRLNDLRHIIYKDFATSSRQALTNLGLMLREGLLKENIDGEALLWALRRCSEHTAQRRLIVVLCDGAPVDDSTLQENRQGFLIDHLKFVTGHIEKETDVSLLAVGIGHDASGFFGDAITIEHLSLAAPKVCQAIAQRLSLRGPD